VTPLAKCFLDFLPFKLIPLPEDTQLFDEALTYLLYLLREVDRDGGVLESSYLVSVGLGGRPPGAAAPPPRGPRLSAPRRQRERSLSQFFTPGL